MEGGCVEQVVPTSDSSVVSFTAHDIPTVDPVKSDSVVVVDSSSPSDDDNDDSLAEVADQDSAAVSLVDLRAKIIKQVACFSCNVCRFTVCLLTVEYICDYSCL